MCSKRFRSSYCRKLDRLEKNVCSRPNFLDELARNRLKQRLSLPRQLSKTKPIRFRPTVLNTWERVKSRRRIFLLSFFFSTVSSFFFPFFFKICLHSSFSPFYVQKANFWPPTFILISLWMFLYSICRTLSFAHVFIYLFPLVYSLKRLFATTTVLTAIFERMVKSRLFSCTEWNKGHSISWCNISWKPTLWRHQFSSRSHGW